MFGNWGIGLFSSTPRTAAESLTVGKNVATVWYSWVHSEQACLSDTLIPPHSPRIANASYVRSAIDGLSCVSRIIFEAFAMV